jgi:hypothetical protein
MALFDDGCTSSVEDLSGHDTQLLDVANIEGIDVTRKLALAQDEIGIELEGLLARTGRPSAGQVVVTPALKLWHAFRTLELVYRDAYSSQLNDRYAGKRDEYHELAGWARGKLVESGIGIASDPIPQAAQPILAAATGALPNAVYYVAAAWTNAAGEEGAASVASTITTSGSSFSVSVAGTPKNAKGWNVYAGTSPQALVLQNSNPLAVNASWTQPSLLVTAGRTAGTGQAPNYLRHTPRILQRG